MGRAKLNVTKTTKLSSYLIKYRHHYFILIAFFVTLFLTSTLFSIEAHAVKRWPYNQPYNEQEELAKSLCSGWHRGSLWVSNGGPSYYNNEVNISDSDIDSSGYTDVYLRGSVYTCQQATGVARPSYAVHLSVHKGQAYGLSGSLYRGIVPGVEEEWSTEGGQRTFKLYVGDVPADGGWHTKPLSINRCYGVQPDVKAGSCYPQELRVWIKRKKPLGYNIDGQSYAVSGSTTYKNYNNSQPDGLNGAVNHGSGEPTVKPGELARFSSTLKNIPLACYDRKNADMWVEVQNSYFPTYQDVAHYAAASWNSFGHDTTTVISRNRPLANTQCMDSGHREARGIILAPDSTHQFSHTDDCTAARVPSDGSKIGWYVCQKTWWYYANSINIAWTNTTPACFVVKSTFNLIPKIGDGSTSIGSIGQGEEVDAPSIIQNEGGILRNTPVDWSTYDFKVPKEAVQAAGGENAFSTLIATVFNKVSGGSLHYAEVNYGTIAHACDWMQHHPTLHDYATACTTLANAVVSELQNGSNQVNNAKLGTSGAQVGDLICRIMTIRHYNWETHDSSDTNHRISYPKCYRIAKKPSVQVWGNDIRVGSNSSVVTGLPVEQYKKSSIITTVGTVISGATDLSYGGWGEYGMVTPIQGTIQSASGGGLSGYGTGHAAPSGVSASDRNKLSFANVREYGKWGAIQAQPNIGNQFTSNVHTHSGNVALSNFATGTYTVTSPTTKISGEVGAGRSVIIKSKGTVVIDGDVTYAQSSHHKPSDITQLIIVAKNIIIKDTVSRVDAWLIATPNPANTQGGIISTCETEDKPNLTDSYTNGLSASVCNKELHINGPILARELQLRRTFGAEPTPGDTTGTGYGRAAETISMRADAYLWAANYISNTTGNIATDHTIELPPRY